MFKSVLTVLTLTAAAAATVAGMTRAERLIYVGTYTGPESKGIDDKKH